MFDREAAEALFLQHLGWINKLASMVCAKHDIGGAETEDFTSWVLMKVMEDDYAVLRRFRGESELKTYLAVVVARYFVSYVRKERGEWRPSAVAERLGAPASQLERLVLRHGYTVQQAGESLRTAGRTTLSDIELARLLARLPARTPLRPVELKADVLLSAAEGASRADDRVVAAESEQRRVEIMNALGRAFESLDAEERLIVLLHFRDGLTLAHIARIAGFEQKPLYRRVERLRTRLRTLLENEGLRDVDIRDLLFEPESP